MTCLEQTSGDSYRNFSHSFPLFRLGAGRRFGIGVAEVTLDMGQSHSVIEPVD